MTCVLSSLLMFRFVLIVVLQDLNGHLYHTVFLFVWSVLDNIVV